MTKPSRILVDTNVLSDVLYADAQWNEWSSGQLIKYAGQLAVNPMIYAEICYRATSPAQADAVLDRLGLELLELPREALYLAAKTYQIFRKRGGIKSSPLADFFIGAHAQSLGIPILTRDKGRYPTYFPKVPLICPAS
ncbi:MAG: type II toxin-antitoxin system VapC family toxin [Verrucomicrobiae bacterium]|nr:type II toxin-antitoxin system VapC family toxin [Verrucomicrobiae bacterium]